VKEDKNTWRPPCRCPASALALGPGPYKAGRILSIINSASFPAAGGCPVCVCPSLGAGCPGQAPPAPSILYEDVLPHQTPGTTHTHTLLVLAGYAPHSLHLGLHTTWVRRHLEKPSLSGLGLLQASYACIHRGRLWLYIYRY
jgi:hypothetical protein